MEVVVDMGEATASKAPGDVLACIGLGSCIGPLLVDRGAVRRRLEAPLLGGPEIGITVRVAGGANSDLLNATRGQRHS
jgi:chemotaxis receptor (MCP) glutamine deamidase CheD